MEKYFKFLFLNLNKNQLSNLCFKKNLIIKNYSTNNELNHKLNQSNEDKLKFSQNNDDKNKFNQTDNQLKSNQNDYKSKSNQIDNQLKSKTGEDFELKSCRNYFKNKLEFNQIDNQLNNDNKLNQSEDNKLNSNQLDNELPRYPDPNLCCNSGCDNCIWIQYANELEKHFKDTKTIIDEVEKQISDPIIKSFIVMQLKDQFNNS